MTIGDHDNDDGDDDLLLEPGLGRLQLRDQTFHFCFAVFCPQCFSDDSIIMMIMMMVMNVEYFNLAFMTILKKQGSMLLKPDAKRNDDYDDNVAIGFQCF